MTSEAAGEEAKKCADDCTTDSVISSATINFFFLTFVLFFHCSRYCCGGV